MIYNKESFKDFTILYVEDEISIRSSVEQCLNFIFNTEVAANGEEALKVFEKKKIDVIITDINMPIKDGVTMMNDIKKVSPEIPFIITSAYSIENLEKIEKLGVFKYITKPFDIKELILSVIKALS
jgi:DNA-binding NtrC family response regulator